MELVFNAPVDVARASEARFVWLCTTDQGMGLEEASSMYLGVVGRGTLQG